MYTPHIVTLINVSENSAEELIYNVTILDPVFLDLSKRTNINKSGLTDADAATLFIPFSTVGRDGTGAEKQYVTPKVYEALEDKSGYWTLKDGGNSSAVECYFVKGQLPGGIYYGTLADIAVVDIDVVDDETTPHAAFEVESYEDAVRDFDYVYAVTSVDLRDFGRKHMQHFQVGGK